MLVAYALSYLIANAAVIVGFKYLLPTIGSLIGLVEILFGVMFGVWFFAESLPVSTVVGGTLIIAAAALPNLTKLKPQRLSSSQ